MRAKLPALCIVLSGLLPASCTAEPQYDPTKHPGPRFAAAEDAEVAPNIRKAAELFYEVLEKDPDNRREVAQEIAQAGPAIVPCVVAWIDPEHPDRDLGSFRPLMILARIKDPRTAYLLRYARNCWEPKVGYRTPIRPTNVPFSSAFESIVKTTLDFDALDKEDQWLWEHHRLSTLFLRQAHNFPPQLVPRAWLNAKGAPEPQR